MAQPTGSDVHVDAALSNVCIAYKNEDYIGELISPRVPVTKQSDYYFSWNKDFWFRNVVEKRAPGDLYPEGGIGLSKDNTYYCDIFHLAYPINDEDRENQDPAVQLEVTGSEWLADQFLMKKEIDIAAVAFASSWDTNTTPTYSWDDYVNSTPLENSDTAMVTVRNNTARDPNILVIGTQVFDKLKRHPNLLDLYKHTGKGILTQDLVAAAMGIPKLLVGKSIYTTGLEGASSFTYSFIWGKKALWLYVPPAPGLRVPSAMYTFEWTNVGGGLPVNVRNDRDDTRDRNVLRAKFNFDDKVTGTDLGYHYTAAVA